MEQQNHIAVITVSAHEWNETKSMLRDISEKINSLSSKGEKELMTPKEVCDFLKIGRATFDRYKNNSVFDVVRVNTKKYSKIYVKRSELEKLIKEGVI
jgi:hypothetical protein